jgi:hypothetical protein
VAFQAERVAPKPVGPEGVVDDVEIVDEVDTFGVDVVGGVDVVEDVETTDDSEGRCDMSPQPDASSATTAIVKVLDSIGPSSFSLTGE